MPVDPKVQQFLDDLGPEGNGALHRISVAAAREGIDAFMALGGPGPDMMLVRDLMVPGPSGEIPVRAYTPASLEPHAGLVYFHGGGWVIGGVRSHDPVCRHLAHSSGAVVVSVDYRLAPEHQFPAAPEDCYAATAWTHEHATELGVDGDRLAVGGDSAGGNLAAAVAIMARDRGGPPLRFQLLLYPLTDAATSFPSITENGDGYLMSTADVRWFYELYVPDRTDLKDPALSPLWADDVSGLPPALVITAEYDPLRDEGEAYGHRLQEAGVPTNVSRYAGMVHGFFGMPAVFPGAAPALEEAAGALRRAFAT